ncbi:ATP-binding protein [Streptomyces sp. NPDC005373]|uniref:ATP-binding protein n=1 Tax=unclassified Streptomyces TaxID=2593676 RepID=UPI0033B2BCC1
MSFREESQSRLRCVLPFEAAPAEVPLLRNTVHRALKQWGASAVADEAGLAVTELASNVIKHVGEGTPATLVMEPKDGHLRVEVHDKSHRVPSLCAGHVNSECGRGLHLLAAMSLEWGTLLTATGKAVWCDISLEPARHWLRVQRAAMVLDEHRRAAGVCSTIVPTYAELKQSASDVIADLLHWLSAQGGDPDEMLDQAQIHFEAEVA